MKITVFNSSPRGKKSNTHKIVTAFAAGAEEAGAEVENVFLVDKDIGHCRGCFVCWTVTPGECVIKDDMTELIEKVLASDVIVFATPLYIDNVSGIMKNFMDRLIPVADPHLEKDEHGETRHPMREGRVEGKKMVVISNSGFHEQSHFQVLRLLFRRIARNLGQELAGEIYRGAGELLSVNHVMLKPLIARYEKLLRQAGRELVENGSITEATTAALEKPLVPEALYSRAANKNWDALIRDRAPFSRGRS